MTFNGQREAMAQKYQLWFEQAENDLAWGYDSFERKYISQACFISQQVCEKALKALAYYRDHSDVKTHSCIRIAEELN